MQDIKTYVYGQCFLTLDVSKADPKGHIIYECNTEDGLCLVVLSLGSVSE